MVRREVGWAIWVAPVGNGGIILTSKLAMAGTNPTASG